MMKHQRQVKRLIEFRDAIEELRIDGVVDQIESALVLHIDAMIDSFKWHARCAFLFKCPVCSNHHFFYRKEAPYFYCAYSWWWGVRHFFGVPFFHLLHGVDE